MFELFQDMIILFDIDSLHIHINKQHIIHKHLVYI